MSSKTIFDVLYVHSPITYSIGRHLHDRGYLEHEPIVMCGRFTKWPGPCITVVDDGLWNIASVATFLEKMCKATEGHEVIALHVYVPHTAFLLGKLLRMSGVVEKIFYIEEGDASYNPTNVTNPWPNRETDVTELVAALGSRGIIDRLKLDRDRLLKISEMEAIFFDASHPAYSGAYGVSPKVFPLLKNVEVLELDKIDIIPDEGHIWLCMLPCIVMMLIKHEDDKVMLDKLIYGMVMMLRTQLALVTELGGALVIKFHPLDDVHLSAPLRNEINRYGTPYPDFFAMNEFEVGFEPALYNFSKYIVINHSSAKRYIEIFQGKEKIIGINLD